MTLPLPTRFNTTATTLIVGATLIANNALGHCDVHVHSEGRNLTLVFARGGDLYYAAAALAWPVEEHPTERPDGAVAVEHRAQGIYEGIFTTLRFTEPVRPLWPVRS